MTNVQRNAKKDNLMKYALIARKAVCDTPENHLKLGFEKTNFQLFRARTLEARNLKSDFLYPLFIDLFVNDKYR